MQRLANMLKNKKKIRKKYALLICLIIFVLIVLSFLFINIFKTEDEKSKTKLINYDKYYSQYVLINGQQPIYEFINNKYVEKGYIYDQVVIELVDSEYKNTQYFKIKNLGNKYYIKYDSVIAYDNIINVNDRYKNYIPFNENVITSDETTFYINGNKIYTIKESFNLPIIIKKDDRYYVEFDNRLMYILKDDVKTTIKNNNSDLYNTEGVPVLNYHFVYNPEEEICDQILCHTEEQFRTHLEYIKNNGYFTPTMKELENYIDGNLQLPSSVVITIDDGKNVNLATKILEEYKLNATAFIVTSRYNIENDFVKSDYVDLHSHSHNLHNAGTCPPSYGQGGGLTCLSDNEILNDLKVSSELLNGSNVFCYPFYEFNSHSIELLKEAGYTMAFAGEYTGGNTKATVGIDKFRIPRWVIVNYTTMNEFISYVKGL